MEYVISSSMVPQSSRLEAVRTVVESVDRKYGSPEIIAVDTGISTRHVVYHLNAAEILGLVTSKKGRFRVGNAGVALLKTTPDSADEKELYRKNLEQSKFVCELFPNLLSRSDVTTAELAKTIEEKTSLSASTARRRASAIVTWLKTIRAEPTCASEQELGVAKNKTAVPEDI